MVPQVKTILKDKNHTMENPTFEKIISHNDRANAHNKHQPVIWKKGSLGKKLEEELYDLTNRENYDFQELKAEFFEPFNQDVFGRMTD